MTKNGPSKMADASSSFLVIIDVIMTSLLFLKTIYVFANLLTFLLIFLFHRLMSTFGFCQ